MSRFILGLRALGRRFRGLLIFGLIAGSPLASIRAASPNELFAALGGKEQGWWSLEFADMLRANPALITARNAAGETPLHVAARHRYENEVFLLLWSGADVNARDDRGRTPLHEVAGTRREDAWMIRDMLALKGADIDARDGEGWTPVMLAARAGDLRTVEFLVWMGASLGAGEGPGAPSPRDLALAAGHAEAAALLEEVPTGEAITLRAAPRRIPTHVERAFTDAAAKKDFALLTDLMADGVGIDTVDTQGATALHRAVQRAHEDVVTYLLLLGARTDLTDRRGNTPYMAASNWFGLSMDWMRAMLLLAAGDARSPLNHEGLDALGLAVARGNEQSAQLLIWAGADPLASVGEQGTPMHIACREGQQRLIDLLRRNGVTEPEWVDPVPQKRLEQYVKRGLLPQVRELVAGGEVSLATLGGKGRTLLTEAVHSRRPDMADLLLELGSDPEQTDKDGGTLLHATTAWDYGSINLFRARLIARGVALDHADHAGLTPLMKAARHGADWSGLRQLVEAGADLAAKDAKGRTALDLALQSGRGGATRYLLSVNAPYADPETVADR